MPPKPQEDSTPVLDITGLTKKYGRLTVLDNVSLSVPRGRVFGLLGPNGSGKTTLLSILLGVVQPTSGSYSWWPASGKNERPVMSALLEKPNFLPHLPARLQLRMMAEVKRIPPAAQAHEIARVLHIVQLHDIGKMPFQKMSLGMKQRLAIASALLGAPEVIVLDEPTNGLDPQGIIDIRNLILDLSRQENITILLASHILSEIEKTCSHVAVLKAGRLLQSGPISDFIPREKGASSILVLDVSAGAERQKSLETALQQMPDCTHIEALSADEGLLRASFGPELRSAADLNKRLAAQNLYISHLQERRPQLEERFLQALRKS